MDFKKAMAGRDEMMCEDLFRIFDDAATGTRSVSRTSVVRHIEHCQSKGGDCHWDQLNEQFPDPFRTPDGYDSVRWADDVVHLIDLGKWDDGPLWRVSPVCGKAGPGVSSDENAHMELHHEVTCHECISLVS